MQPRTTKPYIDYGLLSLQKKALLALVNGELLDWRALENLNGLFELLDFLEDQRESASGAFLDTQLTGEDATTILETIEWLRQHRLFMDPKVRDSYDTLSDGLMSVLSNAGVEAIVEPDPIIP